MRLLALLASALLFMASVAGAEQPVAQSKVIARPDAFQTLVNPACSHCIDESKRRSKELRPEDRVLAWIRGYSEGGAIPIRFFLNTYRVISDSYGVFVYDPDAGYARGFAPSYEFRFHGWRNGVMVMRHKDGTLYSCLTGVAFDGPRKGTRLTPTPTLVSAWGFWLEKYPHAVAYHMFEKYQPVDLTAAKNVDAAQSRGKPDPRMKENDLVLGAWLQGIARAYPIDVLEKHGMIKDTVAGQTVVVLWEPRTRTASAYRPEASPPRKYKAPQPGDDGVSPHDEGVLLVEGPAPKPRRLSLSASPTPGRFVDAETKSAWDVAGRCTDGELKGWTLDWVDSVQAKWFAWSAEQPETSIYARDKTDQKTGDAKKAIKEIAGTAEFLRLLPKPFATLQAVDPKNRSVMLLIDGEREAKSWSLEPDAEIKVDGWWGRLDQFRSGDRVWAWLKLDRKKHPVSVAMLADAASEADFHASLRKNATASPSPVKSVAGDMDTKRAKQKAWLENRWAKDGLPGTLTFLHVFSGELELTLDHEAMRWGRSLNLGDLVQLTADPPIKGVVKAVTPWRERTVVRVVVGELESSELKIGQRVALIMAPPSEAILASLYPPDLDKPRAKAERIEWLLASTYCVCGVDGDVCTGHFYTLASCNPNGCGMPNSMRGTLGKMIDRGLSDRQIFDELLQKHGPLLLRPHLAP
jgi:hypothetical protein